MWNRVKGTASMARATGGESQAFWVTGIGQGALQSDLLDPPGVGEVLVKTLFSGISRGTELTVFRGRVPASQHDVMRCPHQEGRFPFPVKYGYAAVGRIEDGPTELAGRTVFVLHPHQDRFVVKADAAVPLPADLPPGRGVLAANMETALNVVWDADVEPGDRVAVIGAGVVGLLISHLVVRYPGIELRLFDVDPAKAPVARALGLPFALAPDRDETFDVLIHASGDPRGLALALSHADFEALIVEASWFGDSVVALPLGEAFHSRRLTIRSSQVGAVATRQRARWSHRRRLELALRLLGDDRLDHLITGESPFAKLPQVMTRLASGDLPALCHRIVYS